jgi:hypothetical protein
MVEVIDDAARNLRLLAQVIGAGDAGVEGA